MHISGMAEARALKFCTKGDYINSCQKEDKSPLKGAWFCSCDRFVCTTVEFATNTVTNNQLPLRFKSQRQLVICHRVCCKLACITYKQQIDQVEFEHYRSNMW